TTATACDSYVWAAPLGDGMTYTSSNNTATNVSTNASGCPHTETLNLTVNYSSTGTTTATACDSYVWAAPLGDGMTYTSSNNTATNVSTNASGCPHTETLNLTVNYSSTGTTTATACDSYVWAAPLGDGMTYTSSNNTATNVSTNASGCPHTETLNLTVNYSSTGTTTATACDSYVWAAPLGDGMTYTSSNNTATNVSTNASGCPHTETLNLTVNYSSTGTTTATACDSYVWAGPLGDGMTYTASNNTATNVTTNASGCPHTETLNLTVNYSSTGTTTATACDSYVWAAPLGDGMTYTSSNNTATNVSTNASGCPHTETLNLTVNYSSTGTTTTTECDEYLWAAPLGDNTIYTSSNNTATHVSTNASGCPHTETLNLTINYSSFGTTTATACDSYVWAGPLGDGNTYTASNNTATNVTTNASGCPHTETLNLTVNYSTSNTTSQTACDSYTWPVDGNTYGATGMYTATSTNASGCPHYDTLYLTINLSTSNTNTQTACDTYTWAAPLGDGNTYTASGMFTNVSTNAAGCPHTETLNLTVNYSSSNTSSATACDTYTWAVNGQTYTNSGAYTFVGTNAFGCTHTETLNLTINYSTSSVQTTSACVTYTWPVDGQTYTNSGLYTHVGTNQFGCTQTDTLILTINALPTVTAPDVSSCPGYPVTLGGSPTGGTWNLPNPYSGSATSYTYFYTDINGCTNTAVGQISTNPTVNIVSVTNITGVSASVNYLAVPGAAWYELRWKPVASSTWTVGTNSAYLTKVIVNLQSNTLYEVQCRVFCSLTSTPTWSSSYNFTTNNICSTPTPLAATFVTATTAKLNWTASPGAVSYTVRWKPTSSSTWTSGSSSSTSKTIAGLIPNTNYEFQVRTDCNVGSSAYSASMPFTTLASKAGHNTPVAVSSKVSVYPNPTSDELNVDFSVETYVQATVKVLDMSGRVIKQVQVNAEPGMNNMMLNLADLNAGVYSVQLYTDNELSNVSRIVKE
ncbi:MAG: T9SS type A sorting domain-containing protein, partial [Chitinophagaceae bacterium]|nr:T9SS type A sorting domain-containing protein [Chitinophagaceae bacterium]